MFVVCQLPDSQCSILGGGRWIVDDILTEAKECRKRVGEERTSIYVLTPRTNWRLIASHPKRLLDSIILDSGVKEDVLHDARDFLGSKKWYSERGIPFRRGYLLVSYTCIHARFNSLIIVWCLQAWFSWFRKDLPDSGYRRRTQFGRLYHLPLSNRAGRRWFARSLFRASQALHRAHGGYRRCVP